MKTKRAIFTAMLLLVAVSLTAQEKTGKTNANEVRISYGILTMPEVFNSIMATWSAI